MFATLFPLLFLPVLQPLPTADERAKLPSDGGPEWNRLVFEKSPYLNSHAADPVEWFPWGEEAFATARRENKLIFLSIGFSACHWCHVMARESFQNPAVAKVLNEKFIAIKVDREERPEIDEIYMRLCVAVNGEGGWPLTVILSPDQQPVYVGTYLPATDEGDRPGLLKMLERLSSVWKEYPQTLLASAANFGALTAPRSGLGAGSIKTALASATAECIARFDQKYGGFGAAPKLPNSNELFFVLRRWYRTGDPALLEMVRLTLSKIRYGGIVDQVGGGLHRYTTDAAWRTPHFEKMLFDQALLTLVLLESYQATAEPQFASFARELCDYALQRLRGEEGGFFSSEDAESEGKEGQFYLWKEEEVRNALGERAELWMQQFGFTKEGNFREGWNLPIPNVELQFTPETREELRLLKELRAKRPRPKVDDKVLTHWNGLMIAALARAAFVLNEPRYLKAAQEAQGFVEFRLRNSSGDLVRLYREGASDLHGSLDDYTSVIWGLIELYGASFDTNYLKKAVEFQQKQNIHFGNAAGGFFMVDAEFLGPERPVVWRDGALPSGNSVACYNLFRLGLLTGDNSFHAQAERLITAALRTPGERPELLCFLLGTAEIMQGQNLEVVISGDAQHAEYLAMLDVLRRTYLPDAVIARSPESAVGIERLDFYQHVFSEKEPAPKVFLCDEEKCLPPLSSGKSLVEALTKHREAARTQGD